MLDLWLLYGIEITQKPSAGKWLQTLAWSFNACICEVPMYLTVIYHYCITLSTYSIPWIISSFFAMRNKSTLNLLDHCVGCLWYFGLALSALGNVKTAETLGVGDCSFCDEGFSSSDSCWCSCCCCCCGWSFSNPSSRARAKQAALSSLSTSSMHAGEEMTQLKQI